MSIAATIIATVHAPPARRAAGFVRDADWIEWRADLLGDVAPEGLMERGGKMLYALRSKLEGGEGPTERDMRRTRLLAAARRFDYIELEGERDLDPATLAAIPPDRRIISWHGQATEAVTLRQLLDSFRRAEARLYRFVTTSEEVAAALAPIQFLAATGRRDVIAYADSANATWTRPLAARYGAPVVFGNVANGQGPSPTDLSALVRDYGLPDLHRVTELCAIVGKPVNGSLSPWLHNAAYRAQGASRLFVRFPVESFGVFWQGVVETALFEAIGIQVRGVTVASPHKESALAVAAEISAISRTTGSTNVMVRHGSEWHADTTDADGVLMNLESAGIACAKRRVAVIGCGGSGRPIAAALRRAGADVTLVNRSTARGLWASKLLGLPFVPLAKFNAAEFDVIINATPVGREGEELPVDVTSMPRKSVVVDLVFSTPATPLSALARHCGHTVIDGRDILLAQAARQYKLMIGEEMPRVPACDLLRADVSRVRASFRARKKRVRLQTLTESFAR
ncbi:MAG: 3-dehydroquinate dehydratase / shikimate dehydrogenase [Verrucomicrobiota bacterium]|jgi:3-dehydroquinate dehydratase/shikimate dehydrogenase